MSDFLIQTIDLDNIPWQAVDYGRGLQKYMVENGLSAEDVSSIVRVSPEEIQYLVAGTSNTANALACNLWIRGRIHVESMILDGDGFPGGSWAGKVITVV